MLPSRVMFPGDVWLEKSRKPIMSVTNTSNASATHESGSQGCVVRSDRLCFALVYV